MIKDSSLLKRKILSMYEKDPRGWRVFIGRDVRGYYDVLIVHGEKAWLIKEEQISPYKTIGVGTEIPLEDKSLIKYPYSFGFRPVPNSNKLLKVLARGEDYTPHLIKLLRREPLPLSQINTKVILQGPFIYSRKISNLLSEKQLELDLKLRAELMKLIAKKYTHRLTMYR